MGDSAIWTSCIMRILLIEDTELNVKAAQKQLVDHELTICRSFREAEQILAGDKNGCWYKEDAEFPFDVVLTDLFLPPSPIGTFSLVQHNENEEDVIVRDLPETIEKFGEEIPYGVVIALAAMRRGVPVAIATDGSHHSHPMGWALDLVNGSHPKRLLLGTNPFLAMERGYCMDTDDELGRVKQWHIVLDMLMKED